MSLHHEEKDIIDGLSCKSSQWASLSLTAKNQNGIISFCISVGTYDTQNNDSQHTDYRDKARMQMPAKIFPHLKVKCKLFMGPNLGFDTEQRNSFLIKFGAFYN